MTTVCVRDWLGGNVPSSRIDPPFLPAVSTLFDPSFVVKCPLDTSRHNAESESNSHPGLRSHMALMRGVSPIAISAALPKASALGASLLFMKTPLPPIGAFTLPAWSGLHPGARCDR